MLLQFISNKLKAEACKKAFRAAELNKAKLNMLSASVVDFSNRERYADFIAFYEEVLANPDCDISDLSYLNCYKSYYLFDILLYLKFWTYYIIIFNYGWCFRQTYTRTNR